jgi:hypothetical protein
MAVFLGAIDKGLKIKYRLRKPYKSGDKYVQKLVVNMDGDSVVQTDYSSRKQILINRYSKYPLIGKMTFIDMDTKKSKTF